jgi:hypothetical protein
MHITCWAVAATAVLAVVVVVTTVSKVKIARNRLESPEGDKGIALHSLDFDALESGRWSAPRSGRFTPGNDPVLFVQEAGWAPGPACTCAKNLTPTGIRSPDRPARSQSLYRLSYPGPGNDSRQYRYRSNQSIVKQTNK